MVTSLTVIGGVRRKEFGPRTRLRKKQVGASFMVRSAHVVRYRTLGAPNLRDVDPESLLYCLTNYY